MTNLNTKDKLKNMLDILESKKDEIEKIVTQEKEIEESSSQLKEKIAEIVDKLLNIDGIFEAREEMCRALKQRVGTDARYRYNKAQHFILQERKKLESLNLMSEGLLDLSRMNYNRPFRDKPWLVKLEQIKNIYQINTDD